MWAQVLLLVYWVVLQWVLLVVVMHQKKYNVVMTSHISNVCIQR
jgi:hypothetical protein